MNMKINIVSEEGFTKDEFKLIALLEDDPIFEKIVKLIRKKAGFPENGIESIVTQEKRIKIKDPNQESLSKMNEINPKLLEDIESLINIYGVPYSWQNTLYSIVTLGVAVVPMRDTKGYKTVEIEYVGGLSAISRNLKQQYNNMPDIKPRIEIVIREGVSFDGLIQQLKKQKPIIDKYLSYLHKVPKVSIKNIDINKEILELTKTLKDKDIAEHLDAKYGQKLPFEPNYDTVGKYRNRYLKAISQIPRNKYSLYYLDKILEGGQ